jgi:hypothetical protein
MVVIIFSFVVAEREREKKRERDTHNSSFPLFCVLLRLQKRLPHRRKVVISFPIVSTPTTPKIPPRRRPGFFFPSYFVFSSRFTFDDFGRETQRGALKYRVTCTTSIVMMRASRRPFTQTQNPPPPLYLKNKKI